MAPPPRCSDGINNDSDGKIDFPADGGCANAGEDDEAGSGGAGGGGAGGGGGGGGPNK